MPLTADAKPRAISPRAMRPDRALSLELVPPEPGWPMFAGLGPLGALPTAPRLARRFTTMILAGWGLAATPGNPDLAGTAELVVSELASNVIRAATGADGNPRYDGDGRLPLLWLRLLAGRARVQVEVWDDAPPELGVPQPRRAAADDETGRGLALIRELSLSCGWSPVSGGICGHPAKRVWAILPA
jgi:hypothetical protein